MLRYLSTCPSPTLFLPLPLPFPLSLGLVLEGEAEDEGEGEDCLLPLFLRNILLRVLRWPCVCVRVYARVFALLCG